MGISRGASDQEHRDGDNYMRSIEKGVLGEADTKTHIAHRFALAAGVGRIRIQFLYEPAWSPGASHPNQISISVFDPERFRGARHNNTNQNVIITPDTASPGYLAGEILPGTWTVFVDAHRILGAGSIEYTLILETDGGASWYHGDLHAHSYHSDAKWGVQDLVEHALHRNHDFVTLTDHNTVSGLDWLRAAANGQIIPVRGMELTTFHGHALAIGSGRWHEWRVDSEDGVAMPELCANITSAGDLFVIAHPTDRGDPACTGCDWRYENMQPGNAVAVEVWNGYWDERNQRALELAYRWLNEGAKLVLTAGSDAHLAQPDTDDSGASRALNVVYAEAPTEAAITAGLQAGHSYLSAGPELRLRATKGDETAYMMGDTVTYQTGFELCVEVAGGEGFVLRVVERGEELHRERITGDVAWKSEILLDEPSWFAVEVRDEENRLRALSNPLFFDVGQK